MPRVSHRGPRPVATIEGHPLMLVTKNTHVVIELNEEEAAMLRYFLSIVRTDLEETLHSDFQRFRTDLLYKLPASH